MVGSNVRERITFYRAHALSVDGYVNYAVAIVCTNSKSDIVAAVDIACSRSDISSVACCCSYCVSNRAECCRYALWCCYIVDGVRVVGVESDFSAVNSNRSYFVAVVGGNSKCVVTVVFNRCFARYASVFGVGDAYFDVVHCCVDTIRSLTAV